MKLKQYLAYVSTHIPADSETPTDIVQSLSCLIASRLAAHGRLPASCGQGEDLDMDIVQAGILVGLERLQDHKAELGTLKQYLYPHIAGAMQSYAWERENRVGESRPNTSPITFSAYETTEDSPIQNGELTTDNRDHTLLIDEQSPETTMIAEEEAMDANRAIRAAATGLGKESMDMLLRDAKIGYNSAARQVWADELGVSLGALYTKLARLRRDARDWALLIH